MRLWTIQSKNAYDALMQNDVYHCNPALSPLLEEEQFKPAYDWLAGEMSKRIGKAPANVKYPIWAWYQYDANRKRPDLRSQIHNYFGEHYLIELEIADEDVLLSCFDYWHIILHNGFIHSCPENEFCDVITKEEDAYFESLSVKEQDIFKKESWKRVFDNKHCPWQHVQATFWELKKEHIVRVRKFIGRLNAI